mmetsp:Transcript_8737/g.18117  ORF Transcript_8737/g.18117 Transcript_8737/m.18117 type:complete len:380 (-) Transcript_8737:535-1674(-)
MNMLRAAILFQLPAAESPSSGTEAACVSTSPSCGRSVVQVRDCHCGVQARRVHPCGSVLVCQLVILVEEEGGGEDAVSERERHTLEPVGLPVLHHEGHGDHRHDEGGGLKHVKVQVQRLPHRPPHEDHERDHQQRDLSGGANGHPDGDVHLVLHGEDDGGGVLSGIAHDGEHNHRDERHRHPYALCGPLNGIHEIVGQHRDEDGDDGQPDEAAAERLPHLLLFLVVVVLLLVEVAVRHELEVEEGAIDAEQEEGGEAREGELRAGAVHLRVRGVQHGGHAQADHRQQEQRGVHRHARLIERLRLVLGAADEEGAPQHQQQVRQNGPQQGKLNHSQKAGFQRKETNDDFRHVTEGRVQETTESGVCVGCHLLCHIAQPLC